MGFKSEKGLFANAEAIWQTCLGARDSILITIALVIYAAPQPIVHVLHSIHVPVPKPLQEFATDRLVAQLEKEAEAGDCHAQYDLVYGNYPGCYRKINTLRPDEVIRAETEALAWVKNHPKVTEWEP